jgi:hypothetical protein
MAKGPIITDAIEFQIVSIHRDYPKMTAREIREEVSYKLRMEKPSLAPGFPSLSSVQKVLASYNKGENKSYDEDKPWSLGMSVKHKLQPEATEDLLQIEYLCLAAGRVFTVRQARWVCYLRNSGFVHDSELPIKPGVLYCAAVVYANREQICESLNKEWNTFDIDVDMGLPPSTANVASRVGVIDLKMLDDFPTENARKKIKFPDNLSPEAVQLVLTDLGFTDKEIYNQLMLKTPYIDYSENEDKIEPRRFADQVHAYWLRYLTKGPKWPTLSRQEQKDVLIKLKKQIDIKFNSNDEIFFIGEWEPTEVLKAVGYDVNNSIDGSTKCEGS